MPLTEKEAQTLGKRSRELLGEIIEWRRTVHQLPELKMDTPVTEAFIVRELQKMGISEIRSGVGGHGVTAVIEGALPGKCLGIRADCDGLPIEEQTGLPFASKNGNMHACGHDGHTAMLLGAAKLLLENRDRLHGRVKLIFQPYEEGDGGAKRMLADGVMENPTVDAVTALHNYCTPEPGLCGGDVVVTEKPSTCNIFAYEAVFRGEGAHVCLAAQTPNAVYMACEAVSRISAMELPDETCVNAVTCVNGGVRNNIIPETCTVQGCVRAFEKEKQDKMRGQVEAALHAAAQKFGGTVEIHTTIDVMAAENDPALLRRFRESVLLADPARPCRELQQPQMIGEDFSRYARLVPGVHFRLFTKREGNDYPLHHPKFDLDEQVLWRGSLIFAVFALTWQDEN